MDAIKTGEFGLSILLTENKYNICCLFYDTLDDLKNPDYIRREFYHETNSFRLNKTIFIKIYGECPFSTQNIPQFVTHLLQFCMIIARLLFTINLK
jgi:hypothetical protein